MLLPIPRAAFRSGDLRIFSRTESEPMDVTSGALLSDATVAPLLPERSSLLGIVPQRPLDAAQWAGANADAIRKLIDEAGALLFRGFSFDAVTDFEQFASAAVEADWVEYREAATPRRHVQGNVLTSTEYPSELRIYVHNENSHVTSWPLYLFFHCRRSAAEGGCTPLADCRAVYAGLPVEVRDRFLAQGWQYRRYFMRGASSALRKVFGTDSREGIERYCRENHMIPEWSAHGLVVRYRRWAALRHPRTGEMVWFNHGTFFNVHTLESAIRHSVLSLGEGRYPFNTYYSDGTPIEADVIRSLHAAYEAATVTFPWHPGDVLMVDNMRMAHGREPFRGTREVVVAMKQRIACETLADPALYRCGSGREAQMR